MEKARLEKGRAQAADVARVVQGRGRGHRQQSALAKGQSEDVADADTVHAAARSVAVHLRESNDDRSFHSDSDTGRTLSGMSILHLCATVAE